MSNVEDLRLEAEALRNDMHYVEACDAYCDLIDLTFTEDSEITPQLCEDFTNYADCLIHSYDEEEAKELLDTAWDLLLNAQNGYTEMNHGHDFDEELNYVDELVHDIISRDSSFNEKYEE